MDQHAAWAWTQLVAYGWFVFVALAPWIVLGSVFYGKSGGR